MCWAGCGRQEQRWAQETLLCSRKSLRDYTEQCWGQECMTQTSPWAEVNLNLLQQLGAQRHRQGCSLDEDIGPAAQLRSLFGDSWYPERTEKRTTLLTFLLLGCFIQSVIYSLIRQHFLWLYLWLGKRA